MVIEQSIVGMVIMINPTRFLAYAIIGCLSPNGLLRLPHGHQLALI
jgi:hypothetical protein